MAEATLPPKGDRLNEAGVMTLREHLLELRTRITVIVAVLVVASFALFPFKDAIFLFLQSPLPRGASLQQITPTESLFTFIKLTFILGFGIASPLILYQVIAFVAPGLYPHERRWVYLSIPAVAAAFLAGAAFAWFVVMRFTVGFLASFAPPSIRTELTIDSWADFVIRILLAVGFAFETPFVVFVLAKIGLVKARTLSKYRRYAVVVIAIIAAIITPTPDPFTQAAVGIPMWALYEIGVILARVAAPDDEAPKPAGVATPTANPSG